MLGLHGELAGLMTFFRAAVSQGVTIGNELACFFCHPEREAVVYFLKSFEHTSENCCKKTCKLLAVFLEELKGLSA